MATSPVSIGVGLNIIYSGALKLKIMLNGVLEVAKNSLNILLVKFSWFLHKLREFVDTKRDIRPSDA